MLNHIHKRNLIKPDIKKNKFLYISFDSERDYLTLSTAAVYFSL